MRDIGHVPGPGLARPSQSANVRRNLLAIAGLAKFCNARRGCRCIADVRRLAAHDFRGSAPSRLRLCARHHVRCDALTGLIDTPPALTRMSTPPVKLFPLAAFDARPALRRFRFGHSFPGSRLPLRKRSSRVVTLFLSLP